MGGFIDIANTIKPPESPIQQLGGVMALKGQIQQQQMGEVQLQEARLAQQSQQVLMQKFAENNGDYNKTYADAAASGQVTPDMLLKFRTASVAAQTQMATLEEKNLANLGKYHDLAANEIEAFRALPAAQRTAQWLQGAAGRLNDGGVDISKIMPHLQSLAADPSDENIRNVEIELKGEQWLYANEKAQRENLSAPTPAQARAKTAAELSTAQSAAQRGVIEVNALPQQLQDAHKKNVAETKQAGVATALQTEQLNQLRQSESYIRQADPTGFTSPLPVPEYNKRYDSFTNSAGYKQIQTLQGSYQQFGTILNDLDAGRPMTGAASVVALFNAIGISAEPLAGKGFRINSSTIQEHVGARGLDQAAYQKLLSLKNGDLITPEQVRDYAGIAADVYKNAYVNISDEAHREGLPADFLPRGGGKMIDSTTAKIYANVVAHENPALARDPAKLQKAAMDAARQNGWTVE